MSEEAGTAASAGRRPYEEAIVTAAVDLFGARGFNGASMRDIAAGAGTSLSNLYNYVPGKADLLAQVLRQANDELLAQLVAAVEGAGAAPADRLHAGVRAYVLWSASRQRAGVVAMSEFRYLQGELRSQVVAARDATQRIFGEIVDDGVAAGAFCTPHPHEAARNVVLLCAALSTWFTPDGDRSAEQIADEQARLALAMVEPAPGVTGGR